MTITFPADSNPIAAEDLPGSSIFSGTQTPIGWHNNQRKVLQKLARSYLGNNIDAVEELKSQGQTDTTNPDVVATRQGFNQLRVQLPVMNQYYNYSGMHGGTPDTDYLDKVKEIVLDWVTVNEPTGKPIDETNFENLLRVIGDRWSDFSSGEQSSINTWLGKLRDAKEAWDFSRQPGEGVLLYGNHYTHHYKILFKTYDLLGDSAGKSALLSEVATFATQNLPFGNASVLHPNDFNIIGVDQANKQFEISGDQASEFFTTDFDKVWVANSASNANDGWYTLVSANYDGSSKTVITVGESIASSSISGVIFASYDASVHDMTRGAYSAGESIDNIRRDALHYHHYDLEPWIELAIDSGSFTSTVDSLFTFLETWILNPPFKKYEFFGTSDSFDGLRYAASRSEYLQPEAMYQVEDACRCILAYQYLKQQASPTFQIDERLLGGPAGYKSDKLSSFWYYFFRWVFDGLYG